MARQVLGRIALAIDLTERNTALGMGSQIASLPHAVAFEALISAGTAEGQLDRITSDSISVTTGTDIDLAGSISSEIGAGAVTLAKLNLLYVKNTTAPGGGNLQIGGDANSAPLFAAVNDILVLPPGGVFFWYSPSGVTVTAGTGDILQFAASTGTVTLDYVIAGRSA